MSPLAEGRSLAPRQYGAHRVLGTIQIPNYILRSKQLGSRPTPGGVIEASYSAEAGSSTLPTCKAGEPEGTRGRLPGPFFHHIIFMSWEGPAGAVCLKISPFDRHWVVFKVKYFYIPKLLLRVHLDRYLCINGQQLQYNNYNTKYRILLLLSIYTYLNFAGAFF